MKSISSNLWIRLIVSSIIGTIIYCLSSKQADYKDEYSSDMNKYFSIQQAKYFSFIKY